MYDEGELVDTHCEIIKVIWYICSYVIERRCINCIASNEDATMIMTMNIKRRDVLQDSDDCRVYNDAVRSADVI